MNNENYFYGVIKVYYPLKGYGFITRDKGRDVFFHRTSMIDESFALDGAQVKFQLEKGPTGMHAVNVEKIGG